MSMNKQFADTVIVLDFETTGLSPDSGDRAIEIGAVRIEKGIITDRFQSLMNPGVRISGFIEDYTGITNKMLKSAPSCKKVMSEFSDFIEDFNLVAHNASFDSRFLDSEFKFIRKRYSGEFVCSMLLARRLCQDAPNHKLGTLVEYLNLPTDGTYHRALADAEMTAYLWKRMLDDLEAEYKLTQIPFSLMQKISKTPKANLDKLLCNSEQNQ